MSTSRINPHLVGDRRIIGRHGMGEHQRLDACFLGDQSGVLSGGVVGQEARFERRRIRNARDEAIDGGRVVQGVVNEDVVPMSERD